MFIPKIIFKKMTLKDNIDIIKWSYFDDSTSLDIHKYTLEYFPELQQININTSKKEAYKIIEEIVSNNYHKYENKIEEEIIRYNQLWKEYNDKYFSTLSNYLEIDWPKEHQIINANIGLIPIFPRYLDDYSFTISIGVEDWKLIETSAHETLHFLWFEKWKNIHPEIPRKEYDSPYLSWIYSEMVTDPILNNKPFNNIFTFKEKSYDSFYKIVNGINVMDNLRNIYSKDISINKKINEGFEFIKSIDRY